MSNQTLNTNFDSESYKVIPDIATKIKDLSATKLVYLKFIMQLFPFLNDPLIKVYVWPLIRLLQNIININKNDILFEFEDGLSSVLVTYIFDINDVIKGQLNVEKYEPRHQNLIAIIRQVDYHLQHNIHYDMQYNDRKDLEQLNADLFLI